MNVKINLSIVNPGLHHPSSCGTNVHNVCKLLLTGGVWYTYILYVVYKFSSVLLLRIDGPTFVNLFRNKKKIYFDVYHHYIHS